MKIHSAVKITGLAALACAGTALGSPATAQEHYLGELRNVGFNYCPKGWVIANGATLSINAYQALYSLYGTTYGGDGRTSFAIPDLRGRDAINHGQGANLPNYSLGEKSGQVSVTLDAQHIPGHTHTATTTMNVGTTPAAGTTGTPGNAVALAATGSHLIYGDGAVDTAFRAEAITAQTTLLNPGASPVNHRGPYLTMNWCVATTGTFPSRN